MDQSVTKSKGAHEIIWHSFKEEQADILIGTQMVSKGLDFPKVTLVGILMSDMILNIPSYLASEKAYTLLTQMTGRSGRMLQGEAVIQGYHLDHFVIESLNQDDHLFYEEALKQRRLLHYPPFVSVAQILFEGISFLQTYQHAFFFKKVLISHGYEVLGPSQALIKKIKDHYRFTLTIKHENDDFKPVFDLISTHQKSDIKITCSQRLDQW
jgi:primosomal protein N' (replication factor Y)